MARCIANGHMHECEGRGATHTHTHMHARAHTHTRARAGTWAVAQLQTNKCIVGDAYIKASSALHVWIIRVTIDTWGCWQWHGWTWSSWRIGRGCSYWPWPRQTYGMYLPISAPVLTDRYMSIQVYEAVHRCSVF